MLGCVCGIVIDPIIRRVRGPMGLPGSTSIVTRFPGHCLKYAPARAQHTIKRIPLRRRPSEKPPECSIFRPPFASYINGHISLIFCHPTDSKECLQIRCLFGNLAKLFHAFCGQYQCNYIKDTTWTFSMFEKCYTLVRNASLLEVAVSPMGGLSLRRRRAGRAIVNLERGGGGYAGERVPSQETRWGYPKLATVLFTHTLTIPPTALTMTVIVQQQW